MVSCTIKAPGNPVGQCEMIAMIAKIFNTRTNVSSAGRPEEKSARYQIATQKVESITASCCYLRSPPTEIRLAVIIQPAVAKAKKSHEMNRRPFWHNAMRAGNNNNVAAILPGVNLAPFGERNLHLGGQMTPAKASRTMRRFARGETRGLVCKAGCPRQADVAEHQLHRPRLSP